MTINVDERKENDVLKFVRNSLEIVSVNRNNYIYDPDIVVFFDLLDDNQKINFTFYNTHQKTIMDNHILDVPQRLQEDFVVVCDNNFRFNDIVKHNTTATRIYFL